MHEDMASTTGRTPILWRTVGRIPRDSSGDGRAADPTYPVRSDDGSTRIPEGGRKIYPGKRGEARREAEAPTSGGISRWLTTNRYTTAYLTVAAFAVLLVEFWQL